MNITLENWLRNKLQKNEEMHDYAVATDTVRCWLDEYKQLSQPAVIKSVCDDCTAYPFDERGKTPLCGTCKDNPSQIVL